MEQFFLKNNDSDFNLLAESMPQIVWATNPDGKNIYFNHQWVEYTGLTLEESYGNGWNKPFHPDDQKRAWIAWQNATNNRDTYSLECRLRRADGEYKWWLVRGVPILDQDNNIFKWFGTCTDIEQIKQNEIALRQKELRLRLILDSAKEYAIYMLDSKGYIQTWNIGAELMKGFKYNEVIGKHYSMLFTKEEIQQNRLDKELRIAKEKGFFSEERIRIRKDGSPFLEDINITSMYDGGKLIGFSAFNRDLSNREAAKSDKNKREHYIMNLVHDLRTPLTGAILSAQVIQKANIGFSKIISNLDRINNMVSDLLDANALQSGKSLNLKYEDNRLN